jgi:hypothetical protein
VTKVFHPGQKTIIVDKKVSSREDAFKVLSGGEQAAPL